MVRQRKAFKKFGNKRYVYNPPPHTTKSGALKHAKRKRKQGNNARVSFMKGLKKWLVYVRKN